MTGDRGEEPPKRYPWQDDEYQPRGRRGVPSEHGFQPPPQQTRPLPNQDQQTTPTPKPPRKLTVTRVAWFRSKQISAQAVAAFRRAARADGAGKSGMTSVTYAVMMNYAADAAMAVALANTLFFSAASAESKTKVALYLLITVAPFALIAPVIGPLLDKIQRGRRLALAASCVLRIGLSVVMALNFDNWLLYPAALGSMVLSKSFTVLKSAITPRVLPPEITLSKTNARMTVFGLAAGAVFGAFAAGFAHLFGSPGALWFTAVLCGVNAWLCMKIPSWVEVTEGEVPATLTSRPARQRISRHVAVSLWGNGSIRMLTGFLTLFAAFVVREQTEGDAVRQLLLLGVIAGAAGIGSFLGNAIGARQHFGKPDEVVLACVTTALAATIVAAVFPGLVTAAIVGLLGATASSLAKISLDAVIQDDLPEESRASAFGRSETILQLAWVFGGALGVLLPATFWVGFLVLSVLLALGLTQTWMYRNGTSLHKLVVRRPAPVTP
ncbi:MFS transporter [Lentzea sp. JNUCC 0626]|uniref:MFS transporter n=1 Tax=Lentzea sp. JNUCC 0626 TaxID=3367513 RepID=UPI003747C4A3